MIFLSPNSVQLGFHTQFADRSRALLSRTKSVKSFTQIECLTATRLSIYCLTKDRLGRNHGCWKVSTIPSGSSSAHQPRRGWSLVDIIFQEQAPFKRQERSKEENSRPIYQERLVLSQSTFELDFAKGSAAD